MESSALMTKHNFSKGVGNVRTWVHQNFTELGELLWKNLIQSDLAPPAQTGLPSSPSCALTRCPWLLSMGISDSWVGYPQHKFLKKVLANRKENCLQLKDGSKKPKVLMMPVGHNPHHQFCLAQVFHEIPTIPSFIPAQAGTIPLLSGL